MTAKQTVGLVDCITAIRGMYGIKRHVGANAICLLQRGVDAVEIMSHLEGIQQKAVILDEARQALALAEGAVRLAREAAVAAGDRIWEDEKFLKDCVDGKAAFAILDDDVAEEAILIDEDDCIPQDVLERV